MQDSYLVFYLGDNGLMLAVCSLFHIFASFLILISCSMMKLEVAKAKHRTQVAVPLIS